MGARSPYVYRTQVHLHDNRGGTSRRQSGRRLGRGSRARPFRGARPAGMARLVARCAVARRRWRRWLRLCGGGRARRTSGSGLGRGGCPLGLARLLLALRVGALSRRLPGRRRLLLLCGLLGRLGLLRGCARLAHLAQRCMRRRPASRRSRARQSHGCTRVCRPAARARTSRCPPSRLASPARARSTPHHSAIARPGCAERSPRSASRTRCARAASAARPRLQRAAAHAPREHDAWRLS